MPSRKMSRSALTASGYTLGLVFAFMRLPRLDGSVPVVIRLVRPLFCHTDVLCLDVGQLRELGAQLRELQASHLFVEVLGRT